MPQETTETAAPVAATPEPTTTTTTETASTTQPTGTEIPDGYEFNGDRNSVPEPLKKHVAGIDRYWTKKQQAFAETEKKAREFEQLQASEEFKAFQQFKAKGGAQATPNPTGREETAVEATQEEMDAIALGDQKVLKSVLDRHMKAALDPHTGPIKEQLNALAAKQKEAETAEMIKAFSEAKPDFWNIWDTYEKHIAAAIKTGMPLEEAYDAFKEIESKADERADKRYKASIEAKKAGSVVASTTTGTPDVVYAENENEAKRLAIQMTLKGDPRTVQIKKK